jgi:solute carrier family 25 folate transporter 32
MATRREGRVLSPHFLAGYVAGTMAVLICAPLDTIRNRLQVERFCEKRITETSLIRITQNTIKEEGVSGLYRGLSVTLVALPASQSTYFFAYEACKVQLHALGLGEVWVNAFSAGIAACANNIATNPLWMARTRIISQQLHASTRYTSMWQTIRLITREEGIAALYQGFSASMLGSIHVMVQFPLYEYLKQQRKDGSGPPSYIDMLYLTILPKLLASLVSYPHEVLRSRLQDLNKTRPNAEFRGLWDLVKVTWQTEGLRGFYSGYKADLVRMVPRTYITLTAYERILYYMMS